MAGIFGITLLIAAGVGAYVMTQKANTDIMNTQPSAPPDTPPNTTESIPTVDIRPTVIQPQENPNTMPPTSLTETSLPAYGSITSFSVNTPLTYPHFTITFTGTKAVTPAAAPQLTFTYYNFTIVSDDGRMRTLSWSSGTGVIAPKHFVVDTQLFALELKAAGENGQQLTDSELVISQVATDYFGTKIGVADYLFELIAQLTPLTTQTHESISAILGLDFVSKPLAALMVSIYESDGFGPITHAELRTHRMNSEKKLLILTIDPLANITKANIQAKYPKVTESASPYTQVITALSMPGIFGFNEVWGTITFGFDSEDRLTSVVINAID